MAGMWEPSDTNAVHEVLSHLSAGVREARLVLRAGVQEDASRLAGTRRENDHACLGHGIAAGGFVDVVNACRPPIGTNDDFAHHGIGDDVQISCRQGSGDENGGALKIRTNGAASHAVGRPKTGCS